MEKIKKWIPFIIFIFLCILIYGKHGIIEVKALTTSNYNKNTSSLEITFNSSYDDTVTSNLNSPLNFIGANSHYLWIFSNDIYFNDIDTYTNLTGTFYITYHFKYYHDIEESNNYHFKTDNFNNGSYFQYFTIYEEGTYTTIDNEGKISYDYFITLQCNEITRYLPPSPNSPKDHIHIYGYTPNHNESYIPNFKSSIEVIQVLYSDEGVLPMSLNTYISSQDIIYSNPTDQPYQEEVDNSILGYIKRIFNKIISIGMGILAFPERIIEFFKNLFSGGLPTWLSPWFDNIRNAIVDALQYLFVPESDYFQTKFNVFFAFLEDQLGFLFTPFEILYSVLDKFQNLSNNSSGIIHIPNIYDPFYNQLIISEQDYNIKSIFQSGSLNTYYNLYLDLVDVSLIVLLINMFLKKFNSVFSGDGEHE